MAKAKSPISLLRDGIIKEDFTLVKEAYQLLTGEAIDISDKKKRKLPKGGSSTVPAKHHNLFTDNGTECVEDKEFDKKYPLSVSKRRKSRLVKVNCRKCGNSDEVPVYLAPTSIGDENSSYVCDNCGVGT